MTAFNPTRRAMLLGGTATAMLTLQAPTFAKTASAQDKQIEALIAQMTLEEKAGQLSIYGDPSRFDGPRINPTTEDEKTKAQLLDDIVHGRLTGVFNGIGVAGGIELQKAAIEQSRLKIPLIFAADVIHGLKTVFPIPLGESASFDTDLALRTAKASAFEATAKGIHWTFAPMVDIARDQRWGRVAEGAGEDPYLGIQLAVARVKGFQGDSLKSETTVLACPKHFAAYGAVQGGMEYNTVDIPETTLRDLHLPPFKAAFEAGALSTMSSFNDIAGVPATGNHHLLTEILRGEWNFKGLVVSDYTSEEEMIAHGYAADGADATAKSIMAGCDIAMQSGLYYKHLPMLVRKGIVPIKVVNEAVRRVLHVKKALGLFENPFRSLSLEREATDIGRPDTIALAREAGRKSCVLLKNDNQILPLPKSGKKIALIGPFVSDRENCPGPWAVFPDVSRCVTLEEGFVAAMGGNANLRVVKGSDVEVPIAGGIEAAVAAALASDVVVVHIGEAGNMSGEAQSRVDISVPQAQLDLVAALEATGKPIVVLLKHGRAMALTGAVKRAPAILATWFLGSESGNAIADIVFGDFAPQGRLPVSFPQASGQEPYYYNHRNTGRPQISDDKNYKSRYREVTNEALYPFGHGLSYSKVDYGVTEVSAPTVSPKGRLMVKAKITNTGLLPIHEVAQLYIRDVVASLVRPVRELKGFKSIQLAPGESQTVEFELKPASLGFVHNSLKSYPEPGAFMVWIAPSATTGTPARFELLTA